MDIVSWLYDDKVRGINAALEVSIAEYWALAQSIRDDNELQRKRVSGRGKPYQLLQRDLIEGCVMPPIILAVRQKDSAGLGVVLDEIRSHGFNASNQGALRKAIEAAFESKNMLILDGLQRTLTIGDCLKELESRDPERERFLGHRLRLEVYLGLNKVGILYRMLTLNTGQTPMTLRQQIEMLYRDYLDDHEDLDGIKVIREAEEKRARGEAKYKYSDVVDMFYAFSTGRPESIDRQTLVNKLSELDFLEEFSPRDDDLKILLTEFNRLVRKIESESDGWEFDEERAAIMSGGKNVVRPFGKNVASIFEKVQPMAAFGAEVKRLLRQEKITSISDMAEIIDNLAFSRGADEPLDFLITALDEIASTATKIGNAQREYFRHCFRELLNDDSDSYKDLSQCWNRGKEKFDSLN